MSYEELLQIAEDEDIEVLEFKFGGDLEGYYCDDTILIESTATELEKKCILAEELGHHYTAGTRITDNKYELLGRKWGYEKLAPLEKLIDAVLDGCEYLCDIAEYLDITEEYLHEALEFYSKKYGLFAEVGDYCVYFSPLSVAIYNFDEIE